ncbi:hypothetical protein F5887DRAFT_225440 [Amanita rubescens]|nr:hypothetical protein F5887DRAFT_225440 [Amanita rubescens]
MRLAVICRKSRRFGFLSCRISRILLAINACDPPRLTCIRSQQLSSMTHKYFETVDVQLSVPLLLCFLSFITTASLSVLDSGPFHLHGAQCVLPSRARSDTRPQHGFVNDAGCGRIERGRSVEMNQPYVNPATFRMVVLADDHVVPGSFFETDLPQVATTVRAWTPVAGTGILGDIWSSIATDSNELCNTFTDEMGSVNIRSFIDWAD